MPVPSQHISKLGIDFDSVSVIFSIRFQNYSDCGTLCVSLTIEHVLIDCIYVRDTSIQQTFYTVKYLNDVISNWIINCIIALHFYSFVPNYLASKSFQKRVVNTKFDIYVYA